MTSALTSLPRVVLTILIFMLMVASISSLPGTTAMAMETASVTCKQDVGSTTDGTGIDEYRLVNGDLEATVLTYGATITSVTVPDREGRRQNVTLNLPAVEDYVQGHPLFGSVVGRFANRIANASFSIDGTRFEVTPNAGGKHHIHGGARGFQKIVWNARPLPDDRRAAVELTHTSPDGNEGYPGELKVRIVYAVTADNELVMEYWASTDKPTHINMTNHAYWNLAGAGSGTVLDQVLMINASKSLVAVSRFPTGKIRDLTGTPLDFRTPQSIGSRIQLVEDENYDDCYVLNKQPGKRMSLAARSIDPASGRMMEVLTTQPGVQLYTAKGLSKGRYGPYHAFCLETQHYPDAPNHAHFPSTLLRPGQQYHEITVYRFRIAE